MKDLMKKIALVSILAALGGCAGGARTLPPLGPDTETQYLLGPGDALQITVFAQPDFSGTFRVSESGMIAIPLVGEVPAQRKSLDEFQQLLVERLSESAVKSPRVTVTVSEYRPFFILGEVKNPGSYPYYPNMTVLTAVAVAGGFTYRAAEDEVSVTRQSDDKPREWRAHRDRRVLPGDVIYVFERHL
jgi:polysaccharide export outer membrane protein